VKERNRSLAIGVEYGGVIQSASKWKVGGSLGFGYIHHYHNTILDNSYTGTYYNSSTTPSGSTSSSGTYEYDNQSAEWNYRVKKSNSAFLTPSINILVNRKLSDRFFLEFKFSQRYLLKLNDGKVEGMKMQFPVGIGVRCQLF